MAEADTDLQTLRSWVPGSSSALHVEHSKLDESKGPRGRKRTHTTSFLDVKQFVKDEIKISKGVSRQSMKV